MRDDIDRLPVIRKEGANIEDSEDTTIEGLGEYIIKIKKKSFIATSNNNNNRKITTIKPRKQKWKRKLRYGNFYWQTMEIGYEKSEDGYKEDT